MRLRYQPSLSARPFSLDVLLQAVLTSKSRADDEELTVASLAGKGQLTMVRVTGCGSSSAETFRS